MANSIGSSGSFISGSQTVSSAGTAVALETSFKLCRSLTIIAKSANTGQVFVGGSDVASGTNSGLDANQSISISSDNGLDMSDIYIDVGTNDDGVDFYAVR